jgi:hypothetical protein
MRTSLGAYLGATAAVLALSSCSVNPAAPLCNAVSLKNIATPQLIYPVPGYASVPDASTFIVVAYPAAPADAQTITITPKGEAAVALGPMGAAPTQIPSPHAKVLPGQGVEYGVSLPALKAHTTYAVNYRYASSANLCGSSTTTNTYMGNFTTL